MDNILDNFKVVPNEQYLESIMDSKSFITSDFKTLYIKDIWIESKFNHLIHDKFLDKLNEIYNIYENVTSITFDITYTCSVRNLHKFKNLINADIIVEDEGLPTETLDPYPNTLKSLKIYSTTFDDEKHIEYIKNLKLLEELTIQSNDRILSLINKNIILGRQCLIDLKTGQHEIITPIDYKLRINNTVIKPIPDLLNLRTLILEFYYCFPKLDLIKDWKRCLKSDILFDQIY
jgi:hypothetical protein